MDTPQELILLDNKVRGLSRGEFEDFLQSRNFDGKTGERRGKAGKEKKWEVWMGKVFREGKDEEKGAVLNLTCAYNKSMESAHLCIQLKPETYKRILSFAEKRHVSAEKYVEQRLEEDYEEDGLAYPIEDLIEEEKQALRDMRDGKLQEYDNLEDAFKSLGI